MTRAASRRDPRRFCEIEEWAEVVNARGKPTRHHITYELALPDGPILRTRILRPANTEAYGPSMWSHILTDQLAVTEDEFWESVDDRTPPVRSRPASSTPENALPISLARQLVDVLHLSSDEVGAISVEEAIARMQEFWSRPDD